MNRRDLRKLDRELTAFIGSMVDGMGRVERREALGAYVTGLLLDGEQPVVLDDLWLPGTLFKGLSAERLRQRIEGLELQDGFGAGAERDGLFPFREIEPAIAVRIDWLCLGAGRHDERHAVLAIEPVEQVHDVVA